MTAATLIKKILSVIDWKEDIFIEEILINKNVIFSSTTKYIQINTFK